MLSAEWIEGQKWQTYEGWNFNSGNYLFTTDTK